MKRQEIPAEKKTVKNGNSRTKNYILSLKKKNH